MDYSRKIAERLWNMPDKGSLRAAGRKPLLMTSYRRVTLKRNCSRIWAGSELCLTAVQGAGVFLSFWQNRAVKSHIMTYRSQ